MHICMQNVLKNKYSSLVWMKSNRCHWQKNNCAMVNSVLLLQLLWQSFKLLLSCFIGTNTCMFRCPCLCAYILYSRRQVLCVYLCILSLYPSLIAVFKRELKAWEGKTQTSDSCAVYDAADCIAGLLLLPVESNRDEEGPPSNGEK